MTKKIFASVILLAVFFLIGRAQKHHVKDPSLGILSAVQKVPQRPVVKTTEATPTSKTQAPSQTQQTSAPVVTPSQGAKLLFDGQGGELFSYLFDGGFKQPGQLTQESLKAVQRRFSQAYSRQRLGHMSLGEREAVHRIGILKAMGEAAPFVREPQLKRQIVSFYERILATPHEEIMVKRQALRSLVQTQPELSEAEQLKRISRLDERVLSLSAMSDRELIEAALEK